MYVAEKFPQLSNRGSYSTVIEWSSLWSNIKYIGERQQRNSFCQAEIPDTFNLSFLDSSKLLEKNNTVWPIYGFSIYEGIQDYLACFPTLHNDHFKTFAWSLNPDPSLSSRISVNNTLSGGDNN